jgi:hypothetical protein
MNNKRIVRGFAVPDPNHSWGNFPRELDRIWRNSCLKLQKLVEEEWIKLLEVQLGGEGSFLGAVLGFLYSKLGYECGTVAR